MESINAELGRYEEYLSRMEAELDKDDRDVYACPLCRDTGWISDGVSARRCSCQLPALRQTLQARSGLPSKLVRCTLDNFLLTKYSRDLLPNTRTSYFHRAKQAFDNSISFARACQEGRTPAHGLMFIGPAGCGKTHLAAGIANDLIYHGREVLFLVVPEFLDQLKSSYRRENEGLDEGELVRRAYDAPVLILDDLGAHNFSEWVRNKLFAIVNYRLNRDLPCVVTTNLTVDQLNDNIGERTTSRLVEGCALFRMAVQEDIRSTLRPTEIR